MKKAQVLFFATLILVVAAQGVFADWTESEIQQMYLDFLAGEGIEGWIDSDGDIQFEYGGNGYFMEVNEDDIEFFRIVLWNIWPIESSSEAVTAAFAVDAVNRERKVTKAYTLNDNVWIATELFLSSPDDFKPLFQRCMEEIEMGLDVFIENM